ncbi:ABC transporter permease [Phenylobacterium sp.]|uniref:ABC transporter permease n=1 Tax=Phenylobacterium sp. TaxID=1871053 RepID=UPI00301DB8C4
MLQFLIRRSIQGIPILFGVSIITFALVHLMPGGIVDSLVPPGAPPGLREEIERIYGLDRPLWEQYLLWLRQVLQGNFGISLVTGRPIAEELVAALLNSFKITLAAAVVGFSLGIAFGVLAALHSGRWPDKLFSLFSIAGVSVPPFWFAILLVTVFAFQLNWLPAQGMGPEGIPTSWTQWRHMILPIATLSMIPMGVVGRVVRAATLEVLSQEFVTALSAKGLQMDAIRRHVARNAAPTILAVMGLQFGHLIGGSILVETVFNWPGTGKLLNLAIFSGDIPVIQATVLLLSVIFVILNLGVDTAQALIDPRMRR